VSKQALAGRLLVEEFGVEPGERLQQLHRRMLEADPALTEPADRAIPQARIAVQSAEPLAHSPAGAAAQRHVASPVLPAPAPTVPSLLDTRAPGRAAGDAAGPHPTVGSATEDGKSRSLRAPSAARSRPRWQVWSVRLLAVLIPLASFGMLTWVVIAYEAGRRRSMPLGLGAAAYLGLVPLFLVAMFLNPSVETIRPSDVVAMVVLLLLWFGGTAHVALINFDRSYRPPA
jgi:SARP family transcriptional regulator, regulator of embCAB operon